MQAENPSATLWAQILDFDVAAHDVHQARGEESRLVMPRGSIVVWSEFCRAELNSFRVGEEILERERDWRSRHPSFPRSEYIGRVT